METILASHSRMARLAAAIFLFLCIPMSLWAQTSVMAKVFVAGDPAATAANMLADEFMFRVAMVSNLIGSIIFALMTFMLYRIFQQVDKFLGLLMILPIVAQLAIAFVLESFNFSALLVLKSEPRTNFDVVQQQEAAYFLIRIYRTAMSSDKIILGLSIIPWGMLVLRSGFLPKVFGVLLIISGIGYILDSTTGFLMDRSIVSLIRPGLRGAFLGYIATMIWMLVKGLR